MPCCRAACLAAVKSSIQIALGSAPRPALANPKIPMHTAVNGLIMFILLSNTQRLPTVASKLKTQEVSLLRKGGLVRLSGSSGKRTDLRLL